MQDDAVGVAAEVLNTEKTCLQPLEHPSVESPTISKGAHVSVPVSLSLRDSHMCQAHGQDAEHNSTQKGPLAKRRFRQAVMMSSRECRSGLATLIHYQINTRNLIRAFHKLADVPKKSSTESI